MDDITTNVPGVLPEILQQCVSSSLSFMSSVSTVLKGVLGPPFGA